MSLQTQLASLITAIGNEFKTRRFTLLNMPIGYNLRVAYSAGYAHSTRAAFLMAMGIPSRDDMHFTFYGQSMTVRADGVVTAQDPPIAWLIDGRDTSEIGPPA